jgi:hypothetical protein
MEYLLPFENVAATDAANSAAWTNPAAWLQEKS